MPAASSSSKRDHKEKNKITNYFQIPSQSSRKRKADEGEEAVNALSQGVAQSRPSSSASLSKETGAVTRLSRKKVRLTPEPSPSSSSLSPNGLRSASSSSSLADTPVTPPPNENLPIGAVAAERTQKTLELIAQIKAKASAAAKQASHPPKAAPEFREDLSESDDDDLSPLQPLDLPVLPRTPEPVAPRYSLRKRVSKSPDMSHENVFPAPRPSKKKSDPMGALLKEKSTLQKRGLGSDLIAKAELLLQNSSDDEDDLWQAPSSPSKARAIRLTESDRRRYFGEKGGEGIGALLLQDEQQRQVLDAEAEKAAVGLTVWESSQEYMDTDSPVPQLRSSQPSHFVDLLNQALTTENHALAVRLISLELSLNSTPASRQDFVTFVYNLVLSPFYLSWNAPIFHALISNRRPLEALSICSSEFLRTLGVTTDALKSVSLSAPVSPTPFCFDADTRAIILHRFLVLTAKTAKFCTPDRIPDFFAAVVLIAMDRNVSLGTRRDSISTLNALCSNLNIAHHDSREIEWSILDRLTAFLRKLSPANKFHLVALVAAGSGPVRRLGRWLAFTAITEENAIYRDVYGEVPPLPSILNALTPTLAQNGGSQAIFALHKDTDFVDLKFFVEILGLALTDIDSYVKIDCALSPGSGGGHETSRSVLELVRHTLEYMHGRIVDTQAADLNKTRTKAALHDIYSRITYQRENALKRSAKQKNLKTFFNKP